MEVNLETDERVNIIVDGNCSFKAWGERNEEGTMEIKYQRYNPLVVEGDE